MRTKHLPIIFLSLAYGVTGCGSNDESEATGGSGGGAGASAIHSTSGAAGSGGATSVVSQPPKGGSSAVVASGGVVGGSPESSSPKAGGTTAKTTPVTTAAGGAAGNDATTAPKTGGTGGGKTTPGKGGSTGKTTATGGVGGTVTDTGTGGTTPVGGSTTIDCSAAMPTSGGTQHCGSWKTGKAGNLSFELWSNRYSGDACITYYSTPAFSAKWNNNSDFLARVGIEWGGKSIATLGTITADFTVNKKGDAGGYSYIGIYGWATQPCTEYYIIDDSMKQMPFSPWNMQQKGSATIDGEVYKFFSGQFGGTGGSRCSTPFTQNWSIRQKGRSCGTITISKHFEEWKKAGMGIDNILEAKVLVEAGGGAGSVEFPIANVQAVK